MRHLTISIDPVEATGIADAIGVLNGRFPADDLHVAVNKKSLKISLRQVDLNELKATIDRIAHEHGHAKNHAYTKQTNPMPDEFLNILCGDSEQVLAKLSDNCGNLVFTSPPYDFGLDYDNQDTDEDATDWDAYFEDLYT